MTFANGKRQKTTQFLRRGAHTVRTAARSRAFGENRLWRSSLSNSVATPFGRPNNSRLSSRPCAAMQRRWGRDYRIRASLCAWRPSTGVIGGDAAVDGGDFRFNDAGERKDCQRALRLGSEPQQNRICSEALGSGAEMNASTEFARAGDKVFGSPAIRPVRRGTTRCLAEGLECGPPGGLRGAVHTPIIVGRRSEVESKEPNSDCAELTSHTFLVRCSRDRIRSGQLLGRFGLDPSFRGSTRRPIVSSCVGKTRHIRRVRERSIRCGRGLRVIFELSFDSVRTRTVALLLPDPSGQLIILTEKVGRHPEKVGRHRCGKDHEHLDRAFAGENPRVRLRETTMAPDRFQVIFVRDNVLS